MSFRETVESSLREVVEAVRIDARHFWWVLLDEIDSRTVRLFQAIMYASWLCYGIYGTFWAEPISVVDRAMGPSIYAGWVLLNVFCPLMVAIGCYLPYKDVKSNGEPTKKTGNGLMLQLAGDLGMALTLGAYVAANLAAAWWGKGTYTVFGHTGLMLCALLLAVGDVRRIRQRSRWNGLRRGT